MFEVEPCPAGARIRRPDGTYTMRIWPDPEVAERLVLVLNLTRFG